mgnify:CR=1 FL=1
MAMEFLTDGHTTNEFYPLPLDVKSHGPSLLNWEPALRQIIIDTEHGVSHGNIATRFHNALVEGIMNVANMVQQKQIVMSGGCFQNAYLLEKAAHRLQGEGFQVFWPDRLPPNDGGISLGQVRYIVVARARGRIRQSRILGGRHRPTGNCGCFSRQTTL